MSGASRGAVPRLAEKASRAGGRTVELVAERRLERAVRPVPEPGDGEVAVGISAVGVCGTDVHAFLGREGRYPVVLGHDVAGTVAEVGPGVEQDWVGRRVTVDPTVSCGRCPWCLAGRRNLCERGGYLGMTTPGVMAEVVVVDREQLVVLPEEVSDRAASVLEPCAVALHLLDRVRPLLPEAGEAMIVGAGPIGIVTGQVLSDRGWSVALFEPREARREMAAGFGLDAREARADLADAPGGEPRLVVETSAVEAGVRLAEELASPASVIALVGRAPSGPRPAAMLMKELSVLAVKGGAGKYPEAVRLVAEGRLRVEEIITHAYGFSDAQRAFEETTDRERGVVRSVLEGAW